MAYNFKYDPREEYATYSLTPLGIINIYLGMLRERFSPYYSGQDTGFAWVPLDDQNNPDLGAETDYKRTEVYIEKAAAIHSKIHNFCPAIVLKRAAASFVSPTFEDKATAIPQTGLVREYGQLHSGIAISCYSREEAECEILSNLVWEFLLRARWIIQQKFLIMMSIPRALTEINVMGEGGPESDRMYKADVMLELVFDFNYSHQPMTPKIKEIAMLFQASQESEEGIVNEYLQK
jgi:hypothetical protein